MTLLPDDALLAACEAYEASPCMDLEGPMEAAITAYLASLPKDGLVGRLDVIADALDSMNRAGFNMSQFSKDIREAAATLQSTQPPSADVVGRLLAEADGMELYAKRQLGRSLHLVVVLDFVEKIRDAATSLQGVDGN